MSGVLAGELDAVIAETVVAVEQHGLHAIKFNPPHAYYYRSDPWDGEHLRPFWEAVAALGVPVFFTLGTGPGEASVLQTVESRRRGYLAELDILVRWMERYPDVLCSLTHGFPWRLFLDDDPAGFPESD